ncbi:flavin reductase family protein [Zoogloea sp.]|jgi:flavin reductase (DIM6/NTAB) family NADH-FMN oxidoreductase RutF|uniref:flavin reductase family protein n=3 Tax=Zoogloea sp. TaxID=49181 RepID=UPI001B61F56A|nr:flavin reductase family protein [Zoogloea sp.]MBK6655160.1 flavin reductase family protein [Zoogloea sp.]MBP7446454.1 flavin reductase family protein [Zoogloea sp.]HOY02926.1 flavin reductase family protein [Zoogloea sp.]HPI61912.1 flavin reductase family protein [Zoogloea sp.]
MTVPKNDPAVRAFRDTLGMFPTGVTVITARAPGGQPIGLTVSSFNSVSLTPPLIVWSLSGHLPSVRAFENAAVYAINVLAEDQQDISQRFASRSDDKFAGLEYVEGVDGVPLLPGCVAWFQCRQFARHPGGDHVVFIGEVVRFELDQARKPLVFQGGAYRRLA